MIDGLLSVGFITKAHGLKGEVLVHLTTNRSERVDVGTILSTKRGDLRVVESKAHTDRWRVRFDRIGDRTAAEAWHGVELFAAPLDDDSALWVHEMIGASVVLVDGTAVGVVAEVEANPASDLLVLDSGSLVPLVFVVSFENGRIVIDPPIGLLDLDEAVEDKAKP